MPYLVQKFRALCFKNMNDNSTYSVATERQAPCEIISIYYF